MYRKIEQYVAVWVSIAPDIYCVVCRIWVLAPIFFGGAEGAAEGAAGAAAGLAGVAAVALPVAAALGAIVVVSKLVEAGFNEVAATAQSFVSGVMQLGGSKNLEEMVVEAGQNQTRIAVLA